MNCVSLDRLDWMWMRCLQKPIVRRSQTKLMLQRPTLPRLVNSRVGSMLVWRSDQPDRRAYVGWPQWPGQSATSILLWFDRPIIVSSASSGTNQTPRKACGFCGAAQSARIVRWPRRHAQEFKVHSRVVDLRIMLAQAHCFLRHGRLISRRSATRQVYNRRAVDLSESAAATCRLGTQFGSCSQSENWALANKTKNKMAAVCSIIHKIRQRWREARASNVT